MYNLVSNLTEVILILFQGYCLQRFYGHFMKTKLEKCRGSRFLIMGIWVTIKTVLSVLWVADYNSIKTQGKLFVVIALLIVATMWLYDTSREKKLFLAVTFLAVNEICLIIAYTVLEIGGSVFSLWNWCFEERVITSPDTYLALIYITASSLHVLMLIVFILLLHFALKAIVRHYLDKEYEIRRAELFFILTPGLVGLLISILVRMLMITVENEMPRTLYARYPWLLILIPAILVLCLLSIVYGVRLFQNMILWQREKSSRIILEKQIKSIQENMDEMNRVYAGLKSMRHDMKNQLSVVMELVEGKHMGAGDELAGYLAEMSHTVSQLEFPFQTGNPIVDTILSMKYHEAIQKIPGLKMEAEKLIFPEGLEIQSYDIGIILCNALDNAIEACEKLKQNNEHAFVRIFSFWQGRLFFIEIENSFDGSLILGRSGEFPKTDKKDKELHGIGLMNIKNAAEKYEGAVDWSTSQNKDKKVNVFTLTVMLKSERTCEYDRNNE
ncbi:MAG: GHKL domain-containing protein [Lachnospiraceae bacterium]|nr:GHKL domain-containing protein [Lachnospiraceae bacterium]